MAKKKAQIVTGKAQGELHIPQPPNADFWCVFYWGGGSWIWDGMQDTRPQAEEWASDCHDMCALVHVQIPAP